MPEIHNNRTPDDIVGKIPTWINGKGNIIMLLILCGTIILGFVIPYQESLTAEVLISYDKKYKAIAYMESYGYGNVRKGQIAQIELDAYPRNEFGDIKGKVTQIGSTLEKGKYVVEIQIISIPKEITPFQEMTGKAKVIIGESPIIYKLISILKKF